MSNTAKYEKPEWFPGTPWSVRMAPKLENVLGCGCGLSLLLFIAGVFIWVAGGAIGAALFFGSLALGWIVSMLYKAKKKDYKNYQVPDSELLVLDKRAWEAGQAIHALRLRHDIVRQANDTVNEVRELLYEGARLEKVHGYSPKLLSVPFATPDNWQAEWQSVSSMMARDVIMLEDLAKPVTSI